MFDRFRARKSFQYSRWDGTQRLEDLDAESILDALSDDYLEHGDLRRAIERMMQQGYQTRDGQQRMGMQELLNRLREQRKQRMQRYDMSGVMDDILKKLEHVKQLEREGIQRRLDAQTAAPQQPNESTDPQGEAGASGEPTAAQPSEQFGQPGQSGQSGQPGQSGAPEGMDPDTLRRMLENIANRKLQYLDQLPKDPAGQIKQLTDYDFMDEQARQEFQELLQTMQQQIMQQHFQGMQQAIQSMTPEELARMREMVRALNGMLRERAEGREPDFDSFMQQYGDFFPGVNTLDDLIEQMARRQAAMQAVLDSMSAEQRSQLREMMDQLIGDDRLRVDLAELAMNMEMVAPSNARTKFRLSGDEPLSFAEAMDLMGTLQAMDELESQMNQARRSGDLDSLDPNQLRELVGAEEAQALSELQAMMKMLEDEGLVKRDGERYELTARGIRRIGQKALEDIFAQLKKDTYGQHRMAERGYGGERSDDTKPYIFGDPFHLHIERTLRNAVTRGGAGAPVRLDRDDFEVYRTEHLTQSSTVVMLDMSYSMLLNELWMPAKKVAIALESLIRGQFPRDQLSLVGFSNMAQVYKPEELLQINEWDNVQGTNMIYGLTLARKLLARSRGVNKQIIMITDGGPTMWREGEHWLFGYPPPTQALMQTLQEARRCAKDGVTINVFCLTDEPYLKRFVNQLATVNKGRVFYVSPDNLGEYLLVDYLGSKQKYVS